MKSFVLKEILKEDEIVVGAVLSDASGEIQMQKEALLNKIRKNELVLTGTNRFPREDVVDLVMQ